MNFSISELLLILLIALIVVKPEQLPEVAATLGRFARTIRCMFNKVKDEMNGLLDGVEKPASDKTEQKS